MCRYQWLCWTLTLLGHIERLSLGNWTEGGFRSSFNLWGPNLFSPTTIKSLVLTQCFQAYLSSPIMGSLKAGEKLECACPVRDNGRVSDPWPGRLRPFFPDQALPFATVGYCCTAWQQKEGKHLLRFFFSRLTPNFFSAVVTWLIFSLLWGGFCVCLRMDRGEDRPLVWVSGSSFIIHHSDSSLFLVQRGQESQLNWAGRKIHWLKECKWFGHASACV